MSLLRIGVRLSMWMASILCCALWLEVGAGAMREIRVSTPEEIAEAMRTAEPGDALVMANGVWRDAEILFEGEGTQERPIVLRAETPGEVILTGRSRLEIGGSHLVVEGLWFRGGYLKSKDVVAFRDREDRPAHFCRFTNSAITDYNPPDRRTGYKWVSLYGTHNRVDRCTFRGKDHSGTTLVVWVSDRPNGHRIDRNHFADRPPLGWNGGETIRVGTSDVSMHVSGTVVEYNYFENCNGEAELISNKSCENVYRYNTFVASGGTLTLRHGNRCTVAGNLFLGKGVRGTGGVRVIGEDHRVVNNYFEGLTGRKGRAALVLVEGIPNSPLHRYFQVKRALVAFNTFVNCRGNMEIGLAGESDDQSLPPEGCTIANNIILGSEGPLVREHDAPVDMKWEGNIMYGAPLGLEGRPGIRAVDPELVRGADGLWRPGPGSPAVGAAEGDYPSVLEDIDGQSRGRVKDVGCDQVSDAPAVRRPLTPADVGAVWMRGGTGKRE